MTGSEKAPIDKNIAAKDNAFADFTRVQGSNMFYALISVLSMFFGGLVFRVAVYRYMSVEDVGLVELALAIVAIASSVICLGIPTSIIKFVASQKEQAGKASFIFIGAWIIFFHALLVTLVIWHFFPIIVNWVRAPRLIEMRNLILLGVGASAFLSFWEGAYNGLLRLDGRAGINLTNNIFRVGFGILLIILGMAKAYNVFAVTMISFLIANVWGFALIRKLKSLSSKISIKRNQIHILYKFSLFQFGSIALDQVNDQLAMFLTARFLSVQGVGYYSLASLVVRTIWILPSAMTMITYPLMSKYWSENNKVAMENLFNLAIRVSLVLTTPLVFIIYYLRTDIIHLGFGQSFVGSTTPLAILLVGYYVNAVMGRPTGATLGAVDRPEMDIVRVGVVAITNLVFSFLLIPKWGLSGAAWATTIALIVRSVVTQGLLLKYSGVRISFRVITSVVLMVGLLVIISTIPLSNLSFWRWMVGFSGGCILIIIGYFWGLTHSDRAFIISRISLAKKGIL